MDTSLLATIIGGIAAVIGLGMAAIAIIASRSMKAAQSGQATAADGHTPVSAEEGDRNVAINGNGNLTGTESDPANHDPNAFTDPFAPEVTNEEDTPEVWGSVFDDPAEHTETKWGFAGEDAAESAADEVRPGAKETKEK